jgi:hypothetical protein
LGQFIARVYNDAEASPDFASKIPVVQVTSSTPVVVGKGTSYDVGFSINKWINKPENGAEVAAPVAAPITAPAPAPAAAPASDTEFGF